MSSVFIVFSFTWQHTLRYYLLRRLYNKYLHKGIIYLEDETTIYLVKYRVFIIIDTRYT